MSQHTRLSASREAAFVAVTAWCELYATYEHGALSAAQRAARYPLVLMLHRWDGAIGFPGGMVDPGRTPAEQVVAEALEEARLALDPGDLEALLIHESDGLRRHLFHHPLGTVDHEVLRAILRGAAAAEDALAEGCAFWAHLGTYAVGRGWPRLRAANVLAGLVGEELDVVRESLYRAAPERAWPAAPPGD